ncbi:MAG TPA: hypothetical protein VFO60_03735, partial [Candidatus Dormibacteraeota bacterium]|nr:hypothetical protein [Candidatus Dormibacteraeota bacterium]
NLNVNLGLNLATLATHVGVNEATASTAATPSASGNVDLASLQATLTLLGLPTSASSSLFSCGTSRTTPGTTTAPAGGTCPQSSLALSLTPLPLTTVNVVSTIGLTNPVPGLIEQSSQSEIPAAADTAKEPQERDFTSVANETVGVGAVTSLTAAVASTALHEGSLGGSTGTSGSVGVEARSQAVNVSGTVGGLAVSIQGFNVGATVAWSPTTGFTTTTDCTTAGISINGTVLTQTGCVIPPITLGGLLSIKSDKTTTCVPSGADEVCTADVCLLDITLLSVPGLNSASVCLGKAHASATFEPVTNVAAITITGHVPTPTYFVRLVGVAQTNPASTASATPEQVLDEGADWFADAPYAVNYDATAVGTSDQAAWCTLTYGPLTPGCGYVLYGGSIATNNTANQTLNGQGLGNWQGRLDTNSSHRVGTSVTYANGAGSGPSANAGSTYVLLPVIGGAAGDSVVAYYGLFHLDTLHPGWGTLVKTPDPTNSVVAPTVQSEGGIGWNPDVEGAVSVKLVDTATLDRLGYS